MAASIGSNTAMAAEAENIMGAAAESPVGIEDEMARLRRLNPDITDEEWEKFEKINNPEANGLIKVDEVERMENGHYIIESYYTDAVSPCNEGVKEYWASCRLFVNGPNSTHMATMYLTATFDYDNFLLSKHINVVPGSIEGHWIKLIDGEYPSVVIDENGKPKEKTWIKPQHQHDFIYYAEAHYTITLKLGLKLENEYDYDLMIEVSENGEQVSPKSSYQ